MALVEAIACDNTAAVRALFEDSNVSALSKACVRSQKSAFGPKTRCAFGPKNKTKNTLSPPPPPPLRLLIPCLDPPGKRKD